MTIAGGSSGTIRTMANDLAHARGEQPRKIEAPQTPTTSASSGTPPARPAAGEASPTTAPSGAPPATEDVGPGKAVAGGPPLSQKNLEELLPLEDSLGVAKEETIHQTKTMPQQPQQKPLSQKKEASKKEAYESPPTPAFSGISGGPGKEVASELPQPLTEPRPARTQPTPSNDHVREEVFPAPDIKKDFTKPPPPLPTTAPSEAPSAAGDGGPGEAVSGGLMQSPKKEGGANKPTSPPPSLPGAKEEKPQEIDTDTEIPTETPEELLGLGGDLGDEVTPPARPAVGEAPPTTAPSEAPPAAGDGGPGEPSTPTPPPPSPPPVKVAQTTPEKNSSKTGGLAPASPGPTSPAVGGASPTAGRANEAPPKVVVKRSLALPRPVLFALVGILILSAVGVGAYYFYVASSPTEPIFPPTEQQPPPSEEPPEVPKKDISSPNPLVTPDFVQEIIVEDFRGETLQAALETLAFNEYPAQSITYLPIRLSQTNPGGETTHLDTRTFFENLNIQTPEGVLDTIDSNFMLYIYGPDREERVVCEQFGITDESCWGPRLGFVLKGPENQNASLLTAWRQRQTGLYKLILSGAKSVLEDAGDTTGSEYQGLTIESPRTIDTTYINLPISTMTFDFAIIDEFLVFATSKNALFYMLDKIIQE